MDHPQTIEGWLLLLLRLPCAAEAEAGIEGGGGGGGDRRAAEVTAVAERGGGVVLVARREAAAATLKVRAKLRPLGEGGSGDARWQRGRWRRRQWWRGAVAAW